MLFRSRSPPPSSADATPHHRPAFPAPPPTHHPLHQPSAVAGPALGAVAGSAPPRRSTSSELATGSGPPQPTSHPYLLPLHLLPPHSAGAASSRPAPAIPSTFLRHGAPPPCPGPRYRAPSPLDPVVGHTATSSGITSRREASHRRIRTTVAPHDPPSSIRSPQGLARAASFPFVAWGRPTFSSSLVQIEPRTSFLLLVAVPDHGAICAARPPPHLVQLGRRPCAARPLPSCISVPGQGFHPPDPAAMASAASSTPVMAATTTRAIQKRAYFFFFAVLDVQCC